MLPTLFRMMFSVMLTDAFRTCMLNIQSVAVFNLGRMQAKSKVQTYVLARVNNERDCESHFKSMWKLSTHNQHKKTEAVHQLAPTIAVN